MIFRLFLSSFIAFALSACGPSASKNSLSQDGDLSRANGIAGAEPLDPEDLGLKATVRLIMGFGSFCTGTMIAPDVVVTAAHCLKHAGDIEVSFAAAPDVTIMSKGSVFHEKYQTLKYGIEKLKVEHINDIGIVVLEKPAPPEVEIAMLPTAHLDLGTHGIRAFGYGRTGSDKHDSNILRMVNIKGEVRFANKNLIFFDQRNGKGICQGDSGGPLFTYQEKKPVISALTNGADDVDAFLGQPVGDLCRYSGVGTQVAGYLDWIKTAEAKIKGTTEPKGLSTFEEGFTTDQALCRKPFPTHEEMKAELQKMTDEDPTGNGGVGGLGIRSENPKLIQAYRFLTSYKTYQFKHHKDIDYWHIFKDLSCNKALCAAETIFGKEDGVLYLYVAAKYGLVLSSLGLDLLRPPTPEDQKEFDAYFSVRPWKKGELVPYLKALPMLPQVGLPLPFTRMQHAGIVNPVNSNVLSNGVIQYYSNIDPLPDSMKEQTTYHEIAHNYGLYYGVDSSPDWLKASGWSRENGKVTNKEQKNFVSEYAKKDFFEDFAESFTYYRYYPKRLKERSPERYQYMKEKIYFGREYLSQENCQ